MNIFKRKKKRELKELFEIRFMKISTISSGVFYTSFLQRNVTVEKIIALDGLLLETLFLNVGCIAEE